MAGFDYLSRTFSDPDLDRRRLLIDKQAGQRAYVEALRNQADPIAQGRDWAAFAQSQSAQALKLAWHTCKDSLRFVKDFEASPDPIPGLFILGLGKLGGQDLNFSSDIDLVAFYDPATLPVPEAAGRTHISAQILRRFIKLIDGHKSGAFVWRTDWRLRPDPSVTDLAMSTDAGLDYFHFQSAPWRRLAMLKARVIAGDVQAGQRFLQDLHSFIWRRNLDFSMVEEIAHLKHRIHLEHPDLTDQRRVSHDLGSQNGFHLKLGRGGIRDIEFVANAQQLLWGGRQAGLQTPHTLTALAHLGTLNILPAPGPLMAAYGFFRNLENAVQAYDDGHHHKLPETPERQNWIETVMGQPFSQTLDQVGEYRHHVAAAFDRLFEHAAPPKTTQSLQHAGTLGFSERRSLELNAVLTQIDQHINNHATPEAALNTLQTWFRRLKGLSAYMRALQDAPDLADLAIGSVLESTLITKLIEQSPLAIDCLFAHRDLLETLSAQALIARGQDLLDATSGFDSRLAALRTWINESLYLTYLALISGKLGPKQGPEVLSHLAEGALDLCAQVTAHELGLARLPFTILAMGRLGLGQMAPGSDLDLIFVLDEEAQLETGSRAVSKFISTMNARLAEGRVYEIDTRLRPSGASGPPTLGLSSFSEHQLTRAKTWEHLALTFMRPLRGQWHGSAQQAQRLMTLKTQVLTQTRDLTQWRLDCQLMLRRLLEQRIDQKDLGQGEVKLATGGLMELEYLCAAKMLSDPNLSTHEQAAQALGLASIPKTQRQALQSQRLHGNNWAEKTPDLAEKFQDSCQTVREATHALLGSPETYPSPHDHEETPVLWV